MQCISCIMALMYRARVRIKSFQQAASNTVSTWQELCLSFFSCYGSVKGSSLSQRPRSRSCWLNSELPGRELKKDRASKRSFKECTWVRATLPWQFGSFNHATRSPMGRPWPSRPSMADSLIVRLRRQSLLWSECTVQCAVIRPSR